MEEYNNAISNETTAYNKYRKSKSKNNIKKWRKDANARQNATFKMLSTIHVLCNKIIEKNQLSKKLSNSNINTLTNYKDAYLKYIELKNNREKAYIIYKKKVEKDIMIKPI